MVNGIILSCLVGKLLGDSNLSIDAAGFWGLSALKIIFSPCQPERVLSVSVGMYT